MGFGNTGHFDIDRINMFASASNVLTDDFDISCDSLNEKVVPSAAVVYGCGNNCVYFYVTGEILSVDGCARS